MPEPEMMKQIGVSLLTSINILIPAELISSAFANNPLYFSF